jgi:OH-DDVA oxygenase/3-O-methylgallate 3,4-dioxygenase
MPHAYGFIYKQIFRDKVVPHVPIDTNGFFPPNQPRAARCLAFGQLVGNAIRGWDADLRVCVIASGGLSHFVVDEDFDPMKAITRQGPRRSNPGLRRAAPYRAQG